MFIALHALIAVRSSGAQCGLALQSYKHIAPPEQEPPTKEKV